MLEEIFDKTFAKTNGLTGIASDINNAAYRLLMNIELLKSKSIDSKYLSNDIAQLQVALERLTRAMRMDEAVKISRNDIIHILKTLGEKKK